jgi:hypothetical protein
MMAVATKVTLITDCRIFGFDLISKLNCSDISIPIPATLCDLGHPNKKPPEGGLSKVD